jgi:hypothetical protein
MSTHNNYGRDSRRAPIVSGNPPLTRENSDAYIEVLNFIDAVVQGTQPGPVPQETKNTWAQQLTGCYPMISPQAQAMFAQAPSIWAVLPTGLPRISAAERAAIRNVWVQQFSAISQASPQPEPTSMDTYIREIEEAKGKETSS